MTKSKRLVATLLIAITWGTMNLETASAWTRPMGPCHEQRYRITKDMGLTERQHRNARLIRCVFERFAPSQVDTALSIAKRESGLDPFAWNRWSDCRGTFQMLYKFWPGRVSAYLHERWFPNTWGHVSAFHERANAIIAAKMVRASGWSAWSL